MPILPDARALHLPGLRPSRSPAIPNRIVGRVCSLLRHRGVDPSGLIADFGLPRTLEEDPFVILDADRTERFLCAAEELAGDPYLAVRAAEHAGYDIFGVLLFACSGGTDGRTALERYVRYFGSIHADLVMALEHRETGTLVKVTLPGRVECLGRAWNEHWAAAVTLGARNLAEARVAPEGVWLAHADSRSRAELTRVLGTTNIHFGQGHNGLLFGKDDLTRRVRNGGAPVSALLGRYALGVPPAAAGNSGLRGRLREVMTQVLPDGEPAIGTVARALGMSARTLQRRLSESTLTFQQVLDDLRRDLAIPYVQRGELSLDEVAIRLGYSQVSAFFRAFRRWTGVTPRALRAGEPDGLDVAAR